MPDPFESLQSALEPRYRLERELGRGGMAAVYLAEDRKHRRPVALKVLRPDLATELGPERFLREIETVARLTHPHILPLHDSGEAGGFLYFVMPYVPGETLRDRLQREGPLPLDDALRIAHDVADALVYAHSHGVIHRDIKPANILLSGGHAVVTDFGIATAISAARTTPMEGSDEAAAVGTPVYMSPEQCLGSGRVDGRSDIYSLGCVLYEMLAGVPPFGFGPAAELISSHYADPVPSLLTTGRMIPAEVDQVVQTALAKMPADRFATALQLVEALPYPATRRNSAALATPVLPAEAAPAAVSRRRLAWGLGGIAVAAVALALAALGSGGRLTGLGSPDPSRFVVLPFAQRDGRPPGPLTGVRCESLMYESLSRWADLDLVSSLRVSDALARRGTGDLNFSDGIATARRLGAGRLVWGEVWTVRDSVEVRAALYDVASQGRVLRQRTVRIPVSDADLPGVFDALADSLLLAGTRVPPVGAGAVGTDRLDAWQAYADGHAALDRWELPQAEQQFQRATELDPGYVRAQLWLAQVMVWEGKSVDQWRPATLAALAAPDRLPPQDRAVARALLEMAEQRYPAACAIYDSLVRADSLDFRALFGRGDCRARDQLVIPWPGSRTGWRFRSSHQAAVDAYERALRLLPSTYRAFRGEAFARLTGMLDADWRMRYGYALDPDTVRFVAFPELVHDTLAFYPDFAKRRLRDAWPREIGGAMLAAADRGRRRVLEIAITWAAAFPNSSDAQETLGHARELIGLLRGRAPGEEGALATYRAAQQLTTDSEADLRLGVAQVRVLLKEAAFDSARRLADSILAAPAPSTPEAAVQLVGLAALTGRADRLGGLMHEAAPTFVLDLYGKSVTPPPEIADAALALLGYASLGEPRDSIRLITSRIPRLSYSWAPPDQRATIREVAFGLPLALAFPVVGATVLHRPGTVSYQLEMQWKLSAGDSAWLRHRLDTIAVLRSGIRPGDVDLTAVWIENRLRLDLHDTATAISDIDRHLLTLSSRLTTLLGDPELPVATQPAVLVRLMALRADLAHATGDAATARHWASAVVTLWSGADPILQPVVQRMRGYFAP